MNDQIKAFVDLKFVAMVLQIFMYQSCSIMLEPRVPAFAKRLLLFIFLFLSVILDLLL